MSTAAKYKKRDSHCSHKSMVQMAQDPKGQQKTNKARQDSTLRETNSRSQRSQRSRGSICNLENNCNNFGKTNDSEDIATKLSRRSMCHCGNGGRRNYALPDHRTGRNCQPTKNNRSQQRHRIKLLIGTGNHSYHREGNDAETKNEQSNTKMVHSNGGVDIGRGRNIGTIGRHLEQNCKNRRPAVSMGRDANFMAG